MTQVSCGQLPFGMAGFRCLNNVLSIWPHFCHLLALLPSLLAPESFSLLNISNKTPRTESHRLWLAYIPWPNHCDQREKNADWEMCPPLAHMDWELGCYSRKSVTIKERNGCWVRTKYRKMDFRDAEKYGVELANGRSKTTGDGRRLILFLALIAQQKV